MFRKSNRNKYLLERGLQFLLFPIFTIVSIFVPKKNNIVFSSLLNNEFSDNSRALFDFLYMQPDYREKIYFVINDESKKKELNKIYPNRFIDNRSIKNTLFIMSARYWVCTSLDLPLPTVFQRFIRTVYHLGHGMLYKNVGLGEKEVSFLKKLHYYTMTSNFTCTCATADFFIRPVSQCFGIPEKRVRVLPQPKSALIGSSINIEDSLLLDGDAIKILYAPTWRPYNDVDLFPFEDFTPERLSFFLNKNNVHVWVRVHPRFEQSISEDILSIKNIHLMSVNEYPEVNAYLALFDALITDYSSIYYDFIQLERPVFFFDYDIEDYKDKIGLIDEYETVKCAQSTTSLYQFMIDVENLCYGNIDVLDTKRVNALVNYPIDPKNLNKFVANNLFCDD